jgi:hypothetical protein
MSEMDFDDRKRANFGLSREAEGVFAQLLPVQVVLRRVLFLFSISCIFIHNIIKTIIYKLERGKPA